MEMVLQVESERKAQTKLEAGDEEWILLCLSFAAVSWPFASILCGLYVCVCRLSPVSCLHSAVGCRLSVVGPCWGIVEPLLNFEIALKLLCSHQSISAGPVCQHVDSTLSWFKFYGTLLKALKTLPTLLPTYTGTELKGKTGSTHTHNHTHTHRQRWLYISAKYAHAQRLRARA